MADRLRGVSWLAIADALVVSVENAEIFAITSGISARLSPLADECVRGYTRPTEFDRYQMIRTYFQMLIEEELPDAIGKMKQFASWFTHGVPGGAALRKGIYESKSAPEVLGRVEDFFEAKLCGAAALAREV